MPWRLPSYIVLNLICTHVCSDCSMFQNYSTLALAMVAFLLPITKALMGLQLNHTLISLNDILKAVIDVLLCPKKALGLVCLPNKLAVGTSSVSLAQGGETLKHSPYTDLITMDNEHSMKLIGCTLIHCLVAFSQPLLPFVSAVIFGGCQIQAVW